MSQVASYSAAVVKDASRQHKAARSTVRLQRAPCSLTCALPPSATSARPPRGQIWPNRPGSSARSLARFMALYLGQIPLHARVCLCCQYAHNALCRTRPPGASAAPLTMKFEQPRGTATSRQPSTRLAIGGLPPGALVPAPSHSILLHALSICWTSQSTRGLQ